VCGYVCRIRDIVLIVEVKEVIKYFCQVFCKFLSRCLCVVDYWSYENMWFV
jgi:hypothetical protein